jgi:hypothetical protein
VEPKDFMTEAVFGIVIETAFCRYDWSYGQHTAIEDIINNRVLAIIIAPA